MTYNPEEVIPPGARIKVIGIGGGGGNAVNTMIRNSIEGVEFIACNTDVQALQFALAETKIQIGKELTRGLGAGADPDVGRDAALEDRHAIQEALDGANMVFITAGMGGGTGTGGAAIVAQIARDLGALTVGVVTKPFGFEGKRRRRHAEIGIARLQESVDTLITIPNQRLLQVASPDLSMVDAFRLADNVLVNAVRGISDIINVPGTVNVDFADVKTVMASNGMALMGIGVAEGNTRAAEAAHQAIHSPLLEDVDIEGATGILVNITAGDSLTLMEVNEACTIVQDAAHEDANIIFGAVVDETVGQQIRVTVIATGFPGEDDLEEAVPPRKEPTTRSRPAPIMTRSDPWAGTQPVTTPAVQPAPHPIATPQESGPVAAGPTQVIPPEPVAVAPAQVTPPEPVAEPVVPVMPADSKEGERLTDMTFSLQDQQEPPTDAEYMVPEPVAASPAPPMTEARPAPVTDSPAPAPFTIEGASLAGEPSASLDLHQGVAPEGSVPETRESLPPEKPLDSMPEESNDAQADPEGQSKSGLEDALEMAGRAEAEREEKGDDLDIPAFLRNGMKDLSLS